MIFHLDQRLGLCDMICASDRDFVEQTIWCLIWHAHERNGGGHLDSHRTSATNNHLRYHRIFHRKKCNGAENRKRKENETRAKKK